MTSNTERHKILDGLEDEFRHDLAVHLYSTLLLHQLNPMFPRKNWANWPSALKDVPIPDKSRTYSDLAFSEKEIEGDIGRGEAQNDSSTSKNSVENVLSGVQGDFQNDPADESDGRDEAINQMQVMKIHSVSFEESMTNSKLSLLNELNSLIEHKIHQVAYKKQRQGFAVTIGSPQWVTRELSKKIADRIDKSYNNIIKLEKSSITKKSAKRSFYRSLNWQDVIMSSLEAHESQGSSINTEDYRKFYKKCEGLFESVRFPYRYDDDEQGEYLQNRSGSKVLDVADHAHVLEATHKSNAIYKDFSRRLESKRANDKALKAQKVILFNNKLDIIDEISHISWKKDTSKPQKSSQTKKKYKVSQIHNDESSRLALEHGGVTINEDNYIMRIG